MRQMLFRLAARQMWKQRICFVFFLLSNLFIQDLDHFHCTGKWSRSLSPVIIHKIKIIMVIRYHLDISHFKVKALSEHCELYSVWHIPDLWWSPSNAFSHSSAGKAWWDVPSSTSNWPLHLCLNMPPQADGNVREDPLSYFQLFFRVFHVYKEAERNPLPFPQTCFQGNLSLNV